MTAAGPPERLAAIRLRRPDATRLRRPDGAERTSALAAVRAHLAPSPLVPGGLPVPGDGGWLKLETMQPTGAFKVRGAIAALSALPPATTAVSASAGNHALGMAWAATRLGVPVVVVTPETASPAKLAALDAFTAQPASRVRLIRHGTSYEEAEAHARHLATRPGHRYVSAYSDHAVIAGASTIGAELEGVVAGGDLTVVTPLGGGGLASGLALWAAGRTGTRIVAAEAAASPAVGAAVSAGGLVPVEVRPTLADGLSGNLEEGAPTPAILAEAVVAGRAGIVDVDEDDLGVAIRWLFRTHGLVAEGAGAAAVAAVLAGRVQPAGALVVLVTGRNITAEAYAGLLVPETLPSQSVRPRYD